MPDLTKRESCLFIVNMIAALGILFMFLALLSWYQERQENCWSKYSTEQEAIQNCEVPNV